MKRKLLISLGLLTTLWSCNNQKTAETTAVATDTVATEPAHPPKPVYILPSPLQIAHIFKKSGLKYMAGITNPQSNETKYTSNFNQTLNLGVYSADMAYNVLNKQKQGAISYMKLTKSLADEIGMSSVFSDENLMKRFEANIEREDSIMRILAELKGKTDDYISNNERQTTSTLIFSAAWIESMYLASKATEKKKDGKVKSQLLEQMSILENVIKLLQGHNTNNDAALTDWTTQMMSIHDIFNNFAGVKSYTGDREDMDPMELNITDEEINSLVKKIEEIRIKMING